MEDHKEFTVAEKVAERKGNFPQCRTNFYFLQEQEGLSPLHCSVHTCSETHSRASSDSGKNMWMLTPIPTYIFKSRYFSRGQLRFTLFNHITFNAISRVKQRLRGINYCYYLFLHSANYVYGKGKQRNHNMYGNSLR